MNFHAATGLAWREDGAPDGRPLLFHHGWPSSCVLGRAWQATAAEKGWRVITVDRPGLHRSAHRPGRTLADWPGHVLQLLHSLGVAACPVAGMSGGGPYALACVALRPDRFTAAAVMSGAPPLADAGNRRLLPRPLRWLVALDGVFPRVVHRGLQAVRLGTFLCDPALVRRFAVAGTQWPDSAFLASPLADSTLSSGLAAWRGHRDGVADEARLYLRPWPFEPEAIARPVHFWHGAEDPLFPPGVATALAARIPGAACRILPNCGHFAPLHAAQGPALDWLAAVTDGCAVAGGRCAPAAPFSGGAVAER